MAAQLVFDLVPVHAVAVGDCVRVHPSYSPLRTNVRAGMTGVVVDVRAPIVPCLDVGHWTCRPIGAAIEEVGGRVYGFEYEDLEVIS